MKQDEGVNPFLLPPTVVEIISENSIFASIKDGDSDTSSTFYRYRSIGSFEDLDALPMTGTAIHQRCSSYRFSHDVNTSGSSQEDVAIAPNGLQRRVVVAEPIYASELSEPDGQYSFELSKSAGVLDYRLGDSDTSCSPHELDSSSSSVGTSPSEGSIVQIPGQSAMDATPLFAELHLLHHYKQLAQSYEDALYGPQYNEKSRHGSDALIDDIEKILPGIRLKKNICGLRGCTTKEVSFQYILDYLMQHGLLSPASLECFRGLPGIVSLDLTETLKAGTLLGHTAYCSDIIQVLERPYAFVSLITLRLSQTQLRPEHLSAVGRLPSIQTLLLSATMLTDDSVAYIYPLKHTLICLDISSNPRITDASCFTLSALSKLEVLDIRWTSIRMPGIRRMLLPRLRERPTSLKYGSPIFHVRLPVRCDDYLKDTEHGLIYPTTLSGEDGANNWGSASMNHVSCSEAMGGHANSRAADRGFLLTSNVLGEGEAHFGRLHHQDFNDLHNYGDQHQLRLISDPNLARHLSLGQLILNLSAHAEARRKYYMDHRSFDEPATRANELAIGTEISDTALLCLVEDILRVYTRLYHSTESDHLINPPALHHMPLNVSRRSRHAQSPIPLYKHAHLSRGRNSKQVVVDQIISVSKQGDDSEENLELKLRSDGLRTMVFLLEKILSRRLIDQQILKVLGRT